MKCHYEILAISRDADLSDIKSSYRKLALKWHPDKNPSDTEGAREQFQLVQQAYEVLSDPQERAWYDKHREQIIRGANSEFQDNCLDVFQYFTTTCFKGYGDDKKGFYSTYKTVFDAIIKEDLEFFDDKDEFCDLPRFGDSKSDYDAVVGPFYAFWSSYCTKKSYVWLDPYDVNESRDNKRVVKIIEKENKKIRQKAKKERNEEIRNLVAFVRKRDKRVQEHTKLMEAKVQENRLKQEEISKQRRLDRKRELNESGAQAEWAKFDNVKSELEQIEKSLAEQFGDEFSNSEDESEEDNNLYCVACNKVFKTPKAFQNHESSKKHRENVEKLKEEMWEEENGMQDLDSNEELSDLEETIDSENEDVEDEDVVEDNFSKDKKRKKKNKKIQETIDSQDLSSEDDDIVEDIIRKIENGEINELTDEELYVEDEDLVDNERQKKNKKGSNVLSVDLQDKDEDMLKIVDSDDAFFFDSTKKQKKKKNKRAPKDKITENNVQTTSMDDVLKEKEIVTKVPQATKKQKRKEKENLKNSEEVDTSHCCVTCKSTFQSKNRLFEHLKKTGHGVLLSKNTKSKRNNKEK